MRISTERSNLITGLNIVRRIIPARLARTALSHILITTDGNLIRLSSTNRAISIHAWIVGNVDEEGAIAVPAKTILDFVDALPPGQVKLQQERDTATLYVQGERSKAAIKGLNDLEFYPLPVEDTSNCIPLGSDDFQTAISQVIIATSTSAELGPLSGILLTNEESNGITLAASDGYRLAVRHVSLPEQRQFLAFNMIIPIQAMAEWLHISKILAHRQTHPVLIGISQNKSIFFQAQLPSDAPVSNVLMTSQLIASNFPNYRRLIPDDWKTQVVVSTKELENACQIARIFTRGDKPAVTFHAQPGRLTVSATSLLTGDTKTDIDAVVEGKEVQVAFNPKFIIDCLSVINSPKAMMGITSKSGPTLIRPVSGDDFTYIVMPLALGANL